MSELMIYSEFTPNPNTLKFVVGKTITERTHDFISKEEAEGKSALAVKLFEISDIVGVYLGKTFITVTKGTSKDWSEYEDAVQKAIKVFLESGDLVVSKEAKEPDFDLEKLDESGKKIYQIIEDEVRPAVAMDGGDIVFKGYEDGVVYLHMLGACSGCPSSTMTLKMGIEARLKEEVPEVKEVLQV
ncbi:NifU family protein [bacterium]|jgi:Fe-S cluster biogenesis protein NfuA|nr:NifU family protein [bacterium]